MTLGGAALLCLLIFAAALLYSSVGHAGASGYLAAMALCGVAPAVMKPSALVLNVLVATIAAVQFYRAGRLSFALLWPFAVSSVPFAFLGGALTLPGALYRPAVGIVLVCGASLLLGAPRAVDATTPDAKPVPLPTALVAGAGIGLLSGLTGTGGGIFRSLLLLLMGWAETRESAGVSAAFNLVNSIAGLAGVITRLATLPRSVALWAAAAVAWGVLGSGLGSRSLGSHTLRRLLAAVLVIAGAKLILT
jgi:uncharacterized membrane protein YfcA